MKKEISKLLEALNKETLFLSSTSQMAETKTYKEIEKQGKEVVPFLIENLENKENTPVWPMLMLLHDLTGETPYTPDKRGHVDEMIAAWKAWKPKNLKEEAAQIILESAKKREKKTAKPIPHEDIGDPNQKILATEETQIDETITKSMSSGKVVDDIVHSKNKMFLTAFKEKAYISRISNLLS